MSDLSGFLADPDEEAVFDGGGITVDSDELSNNGPPEDWPEEVRRAFWTAVNAPTCERSQRETLRFAILLKRHVREESIQETQP